MGSSLVAWFCKWRQSPQDEAGLGGPFPMSMPLRMMSERLAPHSSSASFPQVLLTYQCQDRLHRLPSSFRHRILCLACLLIIIIGNMYSLPHTGRPIHPAILRPSGSKSWLQQYRSALTTHLSKSSIALSTPQMLISGRRDQGPAAQVPHRLRSGRCNHEVARP